MRNFNFNWMKNAAKNTQTTGGGTSRRCEDANQSRIASDPIPCRYRVDTVSLPCFGYTPGISGRLMKYAAMIALLLTLACGQAWGATSYYNLFYGATKAVDGSNVNSDDFKYFGATINTSATSTTIDGNTYAHFLQLKGYATSIASDSTKVLAYDAKTTHTKVTAYVKNGDSSSRTFYIGRIVEGETSEQTGSGKQVTQNVTAGSTAKITFELDNTKNTLFGLFGGGKAKWEIYQVIVEESGTPLLKGGETGYELAFPGRVGASGKNTATTTPTMIDGMELRASNSLNYLGSPLKLKQTTSYIKFTLTTSRTVKVTPYNARKFIFSTTATPSGSETKYGGTGGTEVSVELEAGTYYLESESSNELQLSKLAFAAGSGGGEEKDYTVTAATSTGTNTYGTVSAAASSLNEDETTTITATPAAGYQVTNWAVSGTDASISPSGASNATSTMLTMGTENATVTATFGPKSYTVTLNNQSATTAGTESVTTTYNANTNLTSAITCPTKTSKVFAGYFTATNGGGVQLIDAAGNWIASAGGGSTYMDGSKNWKNDGDLTLYACWMEYANSLDLQNYVETKVGSSAGDKSTSDSFTYLTGNNYICSLGGSTVLDNSDDAAYRGLKFKNSGDYILFLVPANYSLSVKWGYVKSSKPKYSINGGAAQTFTTLSTSADNTSSPGEIEISSQSYIQLVKLMTSDANATVLKEVTITSAAPSCTAPNHVDISGNWDYFGGETISLTATPYSSAGTGSPITSGITGYQWQKLISSTWTDVEDGTDEGTTISGATTANLQIAGCTGEHSGKYRCTISTGATCSTSSATATDGTEGFQVKVFTLECYTGGTTVYHFTRIGETQTGSTTITLAASTGYQFKFHIDGTYYGNSGTINEDVSNWVCTSGAGNLTINSGLGGTFTITMDYSDGGSSSTVGEPEISVTYPRKTIYLNAGGSDLWDKDNAKFGIYYFRKESETLYGHAWTDIMPAYACGSGIYVTEIPQWNGVKIDAVRLNPSATNNNKSDWWTSYKYNQTNDCPVTSNDYITITGWNEPDYTYTTYDAPKYTISFDGNGETSGSMTDVEDIECDASVTLEANAFVKTGYTFTGWKDGSSNDYADEATISNITADMALTAQWSANTISVTLAKGEHGAANQAMTIKYDAGFYLTFTAVSANTGYTCSGYYDGETKVLNADGSFASSTVSGYITDGKWSKADNCTLTAKWSLRSYTLTWDLAGGTVTVAGTGAAVNVTGTPSSSVTYTSAITAPTVTKSGYQFTGWDVTPASTMPAANTTYTAQWAQLYDVAKGAHSDGDITISPTSAVSGATVTITATPEDGYALDAWTIKKTSDGSDVTASVSLSGQTATATFTMPAYGVTVDAAFEEDITTYSVTYADGGKDGGGAAPSDATAYSPNAEVTVLGNVNSMTKTGCTFRGWSDGTTFYLTGQKFNINSDVTLTAVWDEPVSDCKTWSGSPNTFTDGSMTVSTNLILTSGSIGNPSNEDIYSGTKATCFVINGSDRYLEGHLYDGSDISSVTISAATNQSSTYKYAIVFSTSSDFSSTVTPDSCEAPSASATRDDSKLIHEFAAPSGTKYFRIYRKFMYNKKQYGSNQTIRVYGLEVCKAGGGYTNYTVSYADGNTAPASHLTWPSNIAGVPNGKQIVAPAAPTASGYTFGGWYTDSGCTSAWNWGSSTVSKDTTLYAKWTEKSTPAGTTLTPTASSVCSGSSTTLTLNASTSGVEYELYEGETKLRTVTGTGSALSLGSTSNLTAAKTYTVKTVENEDYKGMTLAVEATVSIATATSVSVASTSLAATVGEAFTIDGITASGAGDLSYQWYSYTSSGGAGESLIAGAESDSYTFTPDETGSYYFKCAVTGDCGTVQSEMITVTATDLFDITMGTHTNGSFTIKVGSADAVSTTTASSAGATIAIVATPSSGYVFKNWEILDSSSDDITTTVGATATSASTTFTMPSETVTINAVFVATHTLTVSVSGGVGGTVSPTSTTVGETLTQSISATPGTGYTFGSWAVSGAGASLSSTTTNPTTFTMGTANATVTATFSAKTYGITLDAGNGTGGSESVTMTYNSASHTSITAPSLTGYTFSGWYTGAGGTGTMIMNASGTLQASVDGYTGDGGIWTKDATTTLYAKYTANYPSGYLYITDVMATPEAKAGYTITMTKNSANYGTELVSAFQTDRAGYEHWAYTSGGSGDITLSFSDALPASATAGGLLIDVWWGAEDNRTTSITLNGGDAASLDAVGSSSDRNQVRKVTYTTDLKSLSSVKLTCSGGKVVWFRIGIKDRPGYLLTYDDGDGSGAPSAEYKPNATITLSSTAPTRSGYIFRGWQVGGSGTVYQPGDEFSMPAAAVTLVAKWTAIDFEFKAGTTKGSEPTDGTVITSSNLSTYWTAGAVLTGGTMTNTSGATLGINASYGFVYAASGNRQLTINLTGSKALGAGTVITIYGYSNNSTDACGFKISGNNMSPATYTPASNDCTAFTQTYTVTEGSALDGETSFTVDPANNIRVYLNRIILTGCAACTPIDPELTAGTTTLYLEPAATNTTLTLDKDGSTGSVDWSVSPSGVVSITGSGTEVTITAVAAGSATVKATIGADGTYCGKTVTKDFTVAACGVMPVASAVLTSNSAADEYNATAIISGLSGSKKLNDDGGKFGMTVTGDSPFKDGDIINITGTMDADPTTTTFAVYSSSTASSSSLIYTTTLSASATINVEIEVTGDILTALNTSKTVAVIRTKSPSDGQYNQNPHMSGIYLKRYACSDGIAKFTGEGSDSNWNNEDNWANGKVPTIDDRAIVEKPIVVNIAHAVAKEVILYQNSTNTGSLTIQANKGLEVAGKVQVWNGSALSATTPSDLLLESSSAGNATLIFDNSNSDQATVQMYSKGWTTGEQGGGTWNWQTVGVPVTDATRMNDYYGGYMYEWSSSGWVDKTDMYGALTPFTAYSVSYPTGDAEHLHTYSIDGTLVPTGDKSISIPATTSVMALANSWTAPIHISDIEFTSEPANIFLYNTGYNPKGSAAGKGEVSGDRYAAGTYLCIPKNSAPYLDESYIAPMQGFYVKNKLSSAGTITINYNTVVRPSSDRAIVSGAMHAPKRTMSNLSEPAVLKMYVSDSQHDDRLVLLEREDFSRGFDNGWDGEKFQINAVKTAPRIFAINETGGKESVSAIPELENTVIGFRPGKEETYTIRFEYNGDETLYLRDTRTGAETLITNESEYVFFSDGTNEDARFIIVRVQSTPTGTEEIGAGSKAYKLMIEDHIYIIRDGRMYSVDGALVNLDRK